MKDTFLLITILIATFLLAWWITDTNCTQKWKDTGYESQHELFGGCKVRKAGTIHWFPASNLMEESK